MADILLFNGVTKHDRPAEQVLQDAIDQGVTDVVIAGYKDGEHYFASSMADGGDALWLIEKLKMRLLSVCEIE